MRRRSYGRRRRVSRGRRVRVARRRNRIGWRM